LIEGRELRFHATLRWAHEAIPWALRWVWSDSVQEGNGDLDLNWDIYGEATELMKLAFDYQQLYRCFVLYSRGFFRLAVQEKENRIQFSFRSESEEQRDALSQVYLVSLDTSPIPTTVRDFLATKMPIITTILPYYIDKTGEFSIACETPPDMLELFKEWAACTVSDMRFDMPRDWRFGTYTLEEFRLFWTSLVSIALAHITAHTLADEAVRTKGGAIASAVMELNDEALIRASALFPIPTEAAQSIVTALTYQPSKKYWDPFWQPIIKTLEGRLLISPHLIIGSSPERNLITLLNRSASGRRLYNMVSAEKELEQLTELDSLFTGNRYTCRRRVPIQRADGTTLTDIDLVLYDQVDRVTLLIHAKWLIRPDFVTEVLARDEEMRSALDKAAAAAKRVLEMGAKWLSGALCLQLAGGSFAVRSLIVNRDSIPSGWVYDDKIPVVNMQFLREFVQSPNFNGVTSLCAGCDEFYSHIEKLHPVTLARRDIKFGDFVFEVPTLELAKN